MPVNSQRRYPVLKNNIRVIKKPNKIKGALLAGEGYIVMMFVAVSPGHHIAYFMLFFRFSGFLMF